MRQFLSDKLLFLGINYDGGSDGTKVDCEAKDVMDCDQEKEMFLGECILESQLIGDIENLDPKSPQKTTNILGSLNFQSEGQELKEKEDDVGGKEMKRVPEGANTTVEETLDALKSKNVAKGVGTNNKKDSDEIIIEGVMQVEEQEIAVMEKEKGIFVFILSTL